MERPMGPTEQLEVMDITDSSGQMTRHFRIKPDVDIEIPPELQNYPHRDLLKDEKRRHTLCGLDPLKALTDQMPTRGPVDCRQCIAVAEAAGLIPSGSSHQS